VTIRPFPPHVRDVTVEFLAHLDNSVIGPVYDWHPENRREHTRQHQTSYNTIIDPIGNRMVGYKWESDDLTARITVTIGSHTASHTTHDWHERAPWYPMLPDLLIPWAAAVEKATGIPASWYEIVSA